MQTLAVLVLFAAAPLVTQSPIRRYDVKRAASPPTIDGKLDEAVWAHASAPFTLQFL